jgi:hypothetical protein
MSDLPRNSIDPQLLAALLARPTPPQKTSSVGSILSGMALMLAILGFAAAGYIALYGLPSGLPTPPAVQSAPRSAPQAPVRVPVAPPPQSDNVPPPAPVQQQAPVEEAPQETIKSEVEITKYVDSSSPDAAPIAVIVKDLARPASAPIVIQDGTKRKGTGK